MGNSVLSITSRSVAFFSSSVPTSRRLRHSPHFSRRLKLPDRASSITLPARFISLSASRFGPRYDTVFTAEKKPPIRATPRKVSMFWSRLNTPVFSDVSRVLSPTSRAFSMFPTTSSAYSPNVPFHFVRFSKSLIILAALVAPMSSISLFTLPKPIFSIPLRDSVAALPRNGAKYSPTISEWFSIVWAPNAFRYAFSALFSAPSRPSYTIFPLSSTLNFTSPVRRFSISAVTCPCPVVPAIMAAPAASPTIRAPILAARYFLVAFLTASLP